MADPSGFLKYTRREMPKRRPVPLRLRDWNEVYEDFDHEELKQEREQSLDESHKRLAYAIPMLELLNEASNGWSEAIW